MNELDVNKLSATIPWGNLEEAFLVYDVQKSHTSSLPLRQGPNRVLTENDDSYVAFHHTRTDKGCNLRAFVPAVTGSLQCSMDLQSSDGKAMLLKYVTSYVAKCHDAVKTQQLYSVAVCAPLGLLATNYREEFHPDLEADTIHALFNIPIADDQQYVVNYNIGKYDAVIIDEASMIADHTFDMIHDTLEKQVHRPLVIIAGDECQQPPLKTINGRTTQTTSILKNRQLRRVSQIHSLYQQFRCTDKAYMDFLQYIRYTRPQQYVLDNFQRPLLLFNQSEITDFDIWHTLEHQPDTTFLTVSRAAADRVNRIVISRAFQNKTPLSNIPLQNDVNDFLPFRDMRVVVTQNLDKRTGLVNGQLATIHNSENNTLLLNFPNGKTTFTYPVTTITEDGRSRVHYALNPAYCMTICKTQGANIKKLIVWFDCPTVPSGMG